MVIKEAIHKFPNVWEVTKSQVSYPKGSIHEHPIPTNPKNPEWYVKAYHQSPGKQKFLHDYADDLSSLQPSTLIRQNWNKGD